MNSQSLLKTAVTGLSGTRREAVLHDLPEIPVLSREEARILAQALEAEILGLTQLEVPRRPPSKTPDPGV